MPVPEVDDRSIFSTSHQAAPDHPMTGHPLVAFVPGLGLDADEWQAVLAGLTGSSVVVLLPSLGNPAPRPADLRAEAHASRLLESLPTGTPTILVGHSASCPVVVNAAARSDDVVGLVLVGPVCDPAAQSWPRMLRRWARTATHERPSEAATLARQYRRTRPHQHAARNERGPRLPHRPGAEGADAAGRDRPRTQGPDRDTGLVHRADADLQRPPDHH